MSEQNCAGRLTLEDVDSAMARMIAKAECWRPGGIWHEPYYPSFAEQQWFARILPVKVVRLVELEG